MKNVLVLIHDDPGQEARLQAGLDFTRLVGGHMTCLDVVVPPPPLIAGDMADAYGTSLLLQEERTRESANRARLETRLAGEDVPWDWVEATGDLAGCLGRAAGLADVIVVNRQLDGYPTPDMRSVAADLIVKAARPVLAVPETLQRLAFRHALILWDGSPCAVAAMRAALPLLKQADEVVLFEASDGSVRMPAEDAASYLSRESIGVQIRRVTAGRFEAADLILKEAQTGRHDYIVMGGFGHARLVESLFGGVSRTMLTHSPLPVFFAH
jgi:nucleotide-binding universal stress UspA family protein